MARRRSLLIRLAAGLLVLTLAIFATHRWWLPAAARFLVNDEGPDKADLAVVLAGDAYGHRILKAGELIRAGYVPAALVSGPTGIYGNYESDLAIVFAVERGFPRDWFIPFRSTVRSTREEAHGIVADLRRRNVRRFLLVTTSYHTGRAGRIFRAEIAATGGGIAMRTVAAPDEYFAPDSWWLSRDAQKIFLLEWAKTIATALGK